MRKMLFSVCTVLAVLGCGGDDGDLPECLGLDCIITVYGKCGEWAYDKSKSTEACCNDKEVYNPKTQACCNNKEIYNPIYNPETQYCSNNTVKTYSGTISYGGQTYKTTVIGTQTWFAENLNYDVSGSKCYNEEPDNCIKYGRLYDWSTAMDFPSSCNSSNCSSPIQSPHRGICPDGWHIPNEAEWKTLSNYVKNNSGCSSCDAKKLKAQSGWNSGGNGTDDYGFSALPGVVGYSDGRFYSVGRGYWWSASVYESGSVSAYMWDVDYHDDDAYSNYSDKSHLLSVRCLQD